MEDIAELSHPIEVWKAVEGDPTELVALLRRDERLTQQTRDELANWLEGTLLPVRLPRGRPSKALSERLPGRYLFIGSYGHDTRTELGVAGFRYEVCRRFIRMKGWHLKRAGRLYWSAERLQEKIAERQEIELGRFINYINRPRPKPKPFSGRDYITWRRQQVAREIHHTKRSETD